MKGIVVGSTGMLGQALMKIACEKKYSFTGIARHNSDRNVDITNDNELHHVLSEINPEIIINAAAIVNISECEKNYKSCWETNARAVDVIANWCSGRDVRFIQISTDHYYYGDGMKQHSETAEVNLLNEYAKSKYAAESYALTASNTLVIRTNIVGFRGNDKQPTFVEWIINMLSGGENITLYEDVYTSSIDVRNFTYALFNLIENKAAGILNVASSEVFSKKTFIELLAYRLNLSLSNTRTGKRNIESLPDSMGLDVSKAQGLLGYTLPNLEEVIDAISKDYEIRKCNTIQ